MELKGSLKRKYNPRDVPVIVTQKRKDWYIYIQIRLSDCDIELLETENFVSHGRQYGYHILQLTSDAHWRYRDQYIYDVENLLDMLEEIGALPKT
jgi:hypothetical protein